MSTYVRENKEPLIETFYSQTDSRHKQLTILRIIGERIRDETPLQQKLKRCWNACLPLNVKERKLIEIRKMVGVIMVDGKNDLLGNYWGRC